MAIPKYDEMTQPLLQLLSDGHEHTQRDLAPKIADHFRLTEQERSARLPNTAVTYVRHRLGWAGFHLRKAGLADSPKKGALRITNEGKAFLATNPGKITRAVLLQFEPFRAYMNRVTSEVAKSSEPIDDKAHSDHETTPEERILAAFTELRETLVADILTRLADIDPFRFEGLVLDLLLAMGYGGSRAEAGWVTKKTGDEGIDGIINEDRLGLSQVHIQAKRWKSVVGRREIQSFVGALAGQQASKGVFITTSDYSSDAVAYVKTLTQKVVLIDGHRLAELMIAHGIGVSQGTAYHVKKIDSDYFDEA